MCVTQYENKQINSEMVKNYKIRAFIHDDDDNQWHFKGGMAEEKNIKNNKQTDSKVKRLCLCETIEIPFLVFYLMLFCFCKEESSGREYFIDKPCLTVREDSTVKKEQVNERGRDLTK